jgi:membrane peptidoglycan carboxypeptidase
MVLMVSRSSETYFSKSNKDLTIPEAAVLVGMLKNPSL